MRAARDQRQREAIGQQLKQRLDAAIDAPRRIHEITALDRGEALACHARGIHPHPAWHARNLRACTADIPETRTR
jgi:hypothetical protein